MSKLIDFFILILFFAIIVYAFAHNLPTIYELINNILRSARKN